MNHKYGTQYVSIFILLTSGQKMTGKINIVGFNKLSEFLEKDESKYLKLIDVTLGGAQYKFFMLDKQKIVGFYEEVRQNRTYHLEKDKVKK